MTRKQLLLATLVLASYAAALSTPLVARHDPRAAHALAARHDELDARDDDADLDFEFPELDEPEPPADFNITDLDLSEFAHISDDDEATSRPTGLDDFEEDDYDEAFEDADADDIPDLANVTIVPRAPKGKRCIAWKGEFKPDVLKYWSPASVGGLYNWSPNPPKDTHKLPYWPMLWGDKHISQWQKLAKGGKKYIGLGCNEPNINGQAKMSPEHAAYLFRKYQLPLVKKGWQFGSCAPANGKSGLAWIKQFKKVCPECWRNIKFAAMHYYSTDASNFIQYLKDFHAVAQKPVIVTEVGCQSFSGKRQCNASEVTKFMKTILKFIDHTSWVHSVCYFGHFYKKTSGVNKLNAMMGSNGRPNKLGNLFLYG